MKVKQQLFGSNDLYQWKETFFFHNKHFVVVIKDNYITCIGHMYHSTVNAGNFVGN